MHNEKESNEFSWNDEGAIAVESVEAIAVYTNPKGAMVIRQQDSMDLRGGDAVIVIPRSAAHAVIAAMQKELAEATAGAEEG